VVHQIYKDRLEFGKFHHLYAQLRADDNLFHSYMRMVTSTFDYIKEVIEHECHHYAIYKFFISHFFQSNALLCTSEIR
jgi:hypothetical protein